MRSCQSTRQSAKLLVYDVNFKNLNSLKAEVMRRVDLVGKATRAEELPACPTWMCPVSRLQDMANKSLGKLMLFVPPVPVGLNLSGYHTSRQIHCSEPAKQPMILGMVFAATALPEPPHKITTSFP